MAWRWLSSFLSKIQPEGVARVYGSMYCISLFSALGLNATCFSFGVATSSCDPWFLFPGFDPGS